MSAKIQCRNCGRPFSRAESHRLCKRCRPSNVAHEKTAKRRFRKSIRDHARYACRNWGRERPPNFANFDARLKSWIEGKQKIKEYKVLLAKIAIILEAL
jgi:hypothetical protein